MAHPQKSDFVFRRNGRVHLNPRGRQFSRLLRSRGVRISGSNAGYNVFRGSVKSTGYPLDSPVSPFTSPLVRQRVPSYFNWSLPWYTLVYCTGVKVTGVCNYVQIFSALVRFLARENFPVFSAVSHFSPDIMSGHFCSL